MVRLAMAVLHFQTGVQDDRKLPKSKLDETIKPIWPSQRRNRKCHIWQKKRGEKRSFQAHSLSEGENTFWSLPGGLETAATIDAEAERCGSLKALSAGGQCHKNARIGGVLRRLLP